MPLHKIKLRRILREYKSGRISLEQLNKMRRNIISSIPKNPFR